MKNLRDLCLDCLAHNLHGNISRIARSLPTVHKEMLLERLVSHDRLTTAYLPHVTYNLFSSTLRRISLYKCDQVSDQLLQQLEVSGCRLTHLSIHKCVNVTDAGVLAITRDQTHLQTLELRSLRHLTAKGLSCVCSRNLALVNLSGCENITKEAIRVLLKTNGTIRHLKLSRCKKLDDSIFILIAQQLAANLEVLNVRDLHFVSNASLVHLATHCPNITKLNLYGCNHVTEEGLSPIFERCSGLRELDLSFCMGVKKSVESMGCLQQLPTHLRDLSLCGIQLDNEADLVAAMSRLSALRVVRFCGVPALNDNTLTEILAVIGGRLETLDLSGSMMSPLTDSGLSCIARYCHSLQMIGISMLKEVTGTSLIPLLQDVSRAAQLTELQLSAKKLDAEVLQYVCQNCAGLQNLDVSGVLHVDDAFLLKLADTCTQLTHIGLKGCRQVTDDGVCALAHCSQLHMVVLSGLHSITDRSIFTLANSCPYINEIYLSGCNKVTRAAIRYLVDTCIPRVFFEHRVPNVDPEQLMARNLDTGDFEHAAVF